MRALVTGAVIRTHAGTVVAALRGARVGDAVWIDLARGGRTAGSVASVDGGHATIVPSGSLAGIAAGDAVRICVDAMRGVLGYGLANRAIDAGGAPLDGASAPAGTRMDVAPSAPAPGMRAPLVRPFWTGIRSIDAFLTLGAGARIGLFGAPGAGKSTLLETIVLGAQADAVVVALIGERGREAQRWIASLARPATAAMRTIVCATSDRSAAERVRAADVAMAQATLLRDAGLRVLYVIDSLARYVGALREQSIGLGEPVGRGGYPPSVFAALARYLECAGNGSGSGSLTTIATVLPDGGDDREPLADAARSLLDGHLVLSSEHARAGRFPAIDVLASASRTMNDVVTHQHRSAAERVRSVLATLARTEDLRHAGLADLRDGVLASAVAAEPAIEAFLRHAGVIPVRRMLGELAELGAMLSDRVA